MTEPRGSSDVPPRPEDWVPVEHRILGIDKATIAPSLAVLVFAIVLAVGLPSVDDSVGYDDPIVAGDVMDLVGGTLTFVPAEGWNRLDGSLVGEGPAESVGSVSTVALKDVSVTITTGAFDGTPDELLDRIDDLNAGLEDPRGLGAAGPREEITTASGLTGVTETFTGLDERGITAAFVVDADGTSVGVQIVVRGSAGSIGTHLEEIATMLDTVTSQDTGSTETAS